VRGATTAETAIQLAQHKLTRSAFFGAWEGAWCEAGRSATTGILALPWLKQVAEWGDHYQIGKATQAVDALVKVLGVAREPAWRSGWDAAYDLFTYAPGDIPSPETMFANAVITAQSALARIWPARPIHSLDCMTCAVLPALLNRMVGDFITHTSYMVFTVAMTAAQVAGWRAAYLVNAVSRLDPWRPLIDIWRLGGWPLGASSDSFLVFLPEPRS
jgi:hypothetical protein